MELQKLKRLVWILPLTGLLVAVPFLGRTYAYHTDAEQQNNQMNFANVEVKIQEPGFNSEGIQLAETTEFVKDVSVKNTGTAPCYVRVYMDFSDANVRSYSQLSLDGIDFYSYDAYVEKLSDWQREDDGYFYYKDRLDVDHETTLLLRSVKTIFPEGIEPYEYDIIVYAEAVQVIDENGDAYVDCQTAFKRFTPSP